MGSPGCLGLLFTVNTESSPNVEYGKMRSEPDECALGVDLRGIHSAFYFIRAKPGMPTARRRVYISLRLVLQQPLFVGLAP